MAMRAPPIDPLGPEQFPNQLGLDVASSRDPFSGLLEGAPEGYGEIDPFGILSRLPGDLYPETTEEYDNLVNWCQSAFLAAEAHRRHFETKWERFYRLYNNWIERRPGDWHSTVFIPICFWIVETIVPRLVAQLPKFVTYPVGPEDVIAARNMETLLDWAVRNSGLYIELVAAFKSALKYGTGILKTFYRQDVRKARKRLPKTQPMIAKLDVPVAGPDGQELTDLNGNLITETRDVEIGRLDMGMESQVYQYTAYDGPAAECIDIFNFWPAPESKDIQSARYVVHRTFKSLGYIMRRVNEGVYRLPSNMTPEELAYVDDNPALKRLSSIGYGSQGNIDPTLRQVELLEFWTDDGRIITMANRKALLRVQRNPFDHSEKPFVRIVDYYQEHEFWGRGEIEPLEGLQDTHNALVNSRIDNIRLVINSMFYVNPAYVEDWKDITMMPGGLVRGKGDHLPDEVFKRIDMGDVTSSAFTETELVERTVEKVSGVSAYQMGLDSPSLNETATGVAIIQEQGASRFGLKSKLIELMGIRDIGFHFASILQQFAPEERIMRMLGPQGQVDFANMTPESIHGAIDIDIEAESLQQTQTMRVEQKQNLLGLIAEFAPAGVNVALGELLDALGIKDKERFIHGDPQDPMAQAIIANQMMALGMQPGMGPGGGGGGGGISGQPGAPMPSPGGGPPLPGNPAEGTGGQAMAERAMQQLAQEFSQGASV